MGRSAQRAAACGVRVSGPIHVRMSEQDATAALMRLERAVARIERAVEAKPADTVTEAYALLGERHGLLRRRIQETIERLDTLIGQEG